jgi:NADH-quinone oxidoreductase subunit L
MPLDTTWLLIWILVLPFLVSMATAILPWKNSKGGLAVLTMVAGGIGSVILALQHWGQPLSLIFDWFQVGQSTFTISFYLDQYALSMLVLVYAIAIPVFAYSIPYMRSDPSWTRYWVYLLLFVFGMLVVVTAGNLLLLYIGWELVGVSSYLLIGFWQQKESAVRASKKAFLINRMGDIGLLTAIGVLFAHTQTLELTTLFESEESNSTQILPVWAQWVAGVGFLMAAMAKSAQFPFQTWLPDAMEGPTSVSSLLHAATMVAAGVYVLIRVGPIFIAPLLIIIAFIGAFTAIAGAFFALYTTDFKRLLAFSTISQLGYMVAAIGMGLPDGAYFHLLTHAFFKCALFLIAGIFLHTLHHQKRSVSTSFYDMKGFARAYPLVGIALIIAWMGLNGLPFSAGFLSKEWILSHSIHWSNGQLYTLLIPILLIVTAFLTAIYSTKVLWSLWSKPTETTTSPFPPLPIEYLFALLFLSLGGVWISFGWNPLDPSKSWVISTFRPLITDTSMNTTLWLPIGMFLITTAGCWFARKLMHRHTTTHHGWIYQWASQQFYIDTLIDKGFVRISLVLATCTQWLDRNLLDRGLHGIASLGIRMAQLSVWFDRHLIDRFVNGAGWSTWQVSQWGKIAQNGQLQGYIRWMLILFFIGMMLLIQL